MFRAARLAPRVFNSYSIRNFNSLRTVSSRFHDSTNQNVSIYPKKSIKFNSSIQSIDLLNMRGQFRSNACLLFTQTRLNSTNTIEMLRTSIKKSEETEIDLSNFQVPNIPTQEEIEAMSTIVSAVDLGLTPWLPTGLLFNFFNYIHKLGVEWPITIIISTIIIRTILVPLQISTRKSAAKFSDTMGRYKEFQEELERVQMSGNMMELNKLTMKYEDVLNNETTNKLQGMNKFELFKMPLVQLFLFTSFFLTLRKMCYYPIESLKNSEFLWLPSLAQSDPFYLLPIITSATLFFTLRVGLDTGMVGMANASKVQKIMIYVFPVSSLLITFSFPSALCLYWCTANFHSLLTAYILKLEPVRKYFDLPKVKPSSVRSDFKSIPLTSPIQSFKSMYKEKKLKNEVKNMGQSDFEHFKKAGQGPIKKTYKYDPTKTKM